MLTARDRLHLRLVHVLEELSQLLRRSGRPAAAVEAVHLAVQADPLRESGQRALSEAHQAARNWAMARRQFDAFRASCAARSGSSPAPN